MCLSPTLMMLMYQFDRSPPTLREGRDKPDCTSIFALLFCLARVVIQAMRAGRPFRQRATGSGRFFVVCCRHRKLPISWLWADKNDDIFFCKMCLWYPFLFDFDGRRTSTLYSGSPLVIVIRRPSRKAPVGHPVTDDVKLPGLKPKRACDIG